MHKERGVGAIIVCNDGIYADRAELAETITTLREQIPQVKIIVRGSELKVKADALIGGDSIKELREQLIQWDLLPANQAQAKG